MNDELDVINAALALGDPAVPPKGALLRLGDESFDLVWEVTGMQKIFGYRSVALRGTGPHQTMKSTGYYYIDRAGWIPTQVPTILKLPEGAPPFEQWKRVR